MALPSFNISLHGARTSIRLTRAERFALGLLAQREGLSVSAWCADALARWPDDEGLNRTQQIRSAVVGALLRKAGLVGDNTGPEPR